MSSVVPARFGLADFSVILFPLSILVIANRDDDTGPTLIEIKAQWFTLVEKKNNSNLCVGIKISHRLPASISIRQQNHKHQPFPYFHHDTYVI